MSEDLRIDRRKFLGAAAGVAGAAALGTYVPGALGRPGGPNSPIVTTKSLGIQHWAVRDAVTRTNKTVKGYLGGPNFPDDPTDLGPLVDLPGGFAAVFEYLASVGITGFEFYAVTQAPNPAPTIQQIRDWLDAAGMKSFGTHMGGANLLTAGNRRIEIERANILGHRMIGTAGDPNNGAQGATLAGWRDTAENFNAIGAMLQDEGLKCYFHPESSWWNFCNDPAHPELNNTHKLEYFLEHTDPRSVFFQVDVYHMWANRAARPDSNGNLWDAAAFVKNNWKRLVGYHAKDAVPIVPKPAAGVIPYTQQRVRPGFPTTLNGGVDSIYPMEGTLGQGYPVDPDPNVLGFKKLFTEVRSNRAKGFQYHIIESDSNQGGAQDPGRSLRYAKVAAKNLLAIK